MTQHPAARRLEAIEPIDQASAPVRLRTKTKDDETGSLEEDLRPLAEAMFGGEDLMVRFDMSEFQERLSSARSSRSSWSRSLSSCSRS